MLDKLKAACRHSLTVFVAYAIAAFGALIEILPAAMDLVASPEFSTALRETLPAPWLGPYNIGLAVAVYAARLRSLKGT